MVSWVGLSPLVLFQALLCARDDGHTRAISAEETVIPLLLMVGWMFVWVCVFAVRYRTAYQVRERGKWRAGLIS